MPNEGTPTRKTCTAEVRRSSQWWAIEMPEVNGAYSQTRRLADVEDIARDAIGAVLELDPASVCVSIRVFEQRRYQKSKQAALAEAGRYFAGSSRAGLRRSS